MVNMSRCTVQLTIFSKNQICIIFKGWACHEICFFKHVKLVFIVIVGFDTGIEADSINYLISCCTQDYTLSHEDESTQKAQRDGTLTSV